MAAIFKGECKTCGTIVPIFEDGYLACRLDSGKIVSLPHPIEDSRLRSLGYTYKDAIRDKRLVWVTNVICDTCGHTAELFEPRAHESCLVYVGIIVVSYGICIAFISMPLALLVAMLPLFLLSKIYYSIEQYRMRHVKKLLPELSPCPNCNKSKYIPFSKISRKKSVCQKCGQRTVVYEAWGRS